MARRLVRIAALTTVFAPSFAVALGLGSIETESALNEPLEARIPLQSADAEEIETLNATLASPEAFDRAGLERPFTLSRLEFEVVTEGVREPYLAIRTSEAVREPFLAFLVELNWASGRLIREYTMLLDPPVHSPEEESGTAVAEGDAPSDTRAGEDEAQPSATAGGRSRSEDIAEAEAPQEVEVRSDDTLWEIADDVRPNDGVTVHQMMMALLEANPEAFTDGNVNNLRAGAVLRVPDRDEAQVLSAGEARQQFAAQVEAWQSGRAPEPSQEEPQEEQVAEEAPEPEEGRLEVVAAGETSGDDATASLMEDDLEATPENVERLQSEVSALRESEASLRSENEELRQQTEELLERVEALERTLDIQVEGAVPGMPEATGEDEPELAEAQDDGAADETEAAASGATADAPDMAGGEEAGGQSGDTAADETADDGEAASDQAGMASAETADGAVEEGTTDAGEQAAESEQAAEDAAADEETTAAAEEEPAETATGATGGPLAALWQDPRTLGLGAAGVAALSLLALLVVRRRRNAAEDASASVAAASEMDQAAAESIGVPAEEAEHPAAGEESTAGDAATEPRGDVDPLEEIEVYMAYGRYDQARDLLATAIAGEPERKDLRLKQLEIHALTHDRGGFETDAQELYALVDGPDDPVWQQAREMGREIAPEHPLFAEDDGNLRSPAMMASEPAAAAADDPVTPPETTEPASGEAAVEETAADEDDFGDLDFSLDDTDEEPAGVSAEAKEEPAASADGEADADDGFSLDFDLDDFQAPAESDETAPAKEDGPAAPAAEEPEEDDFSLDFEAWGSDAPSEEAPAEEETAEAAEEDDDTPTYSLDDLDLGGDDDAEAEEEGLRYEGLPETDSDAEMTANDGDLSFAVDDAEDTPAEEPGEPAEAAEPAGAGDDEGADEADDDLFDAGDENSTKLDLARAYLDMGDSEGARSLLDEVIQEGSEEQKAEAESLYDQAR